MAEQETKNQPKDVIEAVPEEIEKLSDKEIIETVTELEKKDKEKEPAPVSAWTPKTKLGKAVREGKEKDIDKILTEGKKILEPEIIDTLLKLESDLISIGQAKGKFGGGKRRAWRQTQKKTMEGNVLSFSSMAVVGDRNGHVGVGYGKSKETLPAREKAVRHAKLNVIKVQRGLESPETDLNKEDLHTIPFKICGKCGSIRLTLWPAPRGTGLVVGDECKKILKLTGIKDVYSRADGKTKTTFNLAKACIDALSKTTKMEAA